MTSTTQDIYGNQTEIGKGFKAALASIIFNAGPNGTALGAGLLVQTIQAQYQQQVTRIWELGSLKTYYIGGRALGQLGMNRILGPEQITDSFIENMGNVCNVESNVITINPAPGRCNASGNVTSIAPTVTSSASRVLRGCVITSVGIAMGAQDMVIAENVAAQFATMSSGG